MVKEILDGTFEEFTKSNHAVIIDCWASWCGPCMRLGPILESLSEEMGDKVAIGKLNVDENNLVPMKFGIRSIPTMLVFVDGAHVDTLIGLRSKDDLKSYIEDL